MYIKIGKIIGVILSIFPLLGLTVKPYWEASEIAASKSAYLLWVLPSTPVGFLPLIWVGFLLWRTFRRLIPTMFVLGGIVVLCGIGISFISADLLERAAPGLYQVEKAKGVDTTIHDYFTGSSNRSHTAVAATITLSDGSTVQALTFYRYDRRNPPYELYRDQSGTYWVGDPAEDATKDLIFFYIFGGLLIMILALLSLLGPVRRFVIKYMLPS